MKYWLYVVMGIVLIFVDQLTKWWVQIHHLFVIKNSGLVFDWGPRWGTWILIATVLILGLFLFTLETPKKYLLPITLILSGAISNLIDRFSRGGIMDFLRIKGDLATNLADIYVVSGVIIYIFLFYKHEAKILRHK
jgi:lipoprotein signal peptidase